MLPLFRYRLELVSVTMGESIIMLPVIPTPPASIVVQREALSEISTFSED
jgi:hypothetical protein